MGRYVSWFTVGFVVGLVVGVPMFFPTIIAIAWITANVLQLPGHMSASRFLSVEFQLYPVWLLIAWAGLWLARRRYPELNESPRLVPFLHGVLSSFPLTTIYIAYDWQTSGIG
jgi:hypothetical protein